MKANMDEFKKLVIDLFSKKIRHILLKICGWNVIGIKGHVKCILTTVTGENKGQIEVFETDNIIPTVGRVATARRWAGIGLKANEGQATYGAVGTGAGTPANGDTTLFTEIERKTLSTTSYTSNTCKLRVFFNTSEANGTLTNFGIFGEDAGAGAGSGTLMEKALITVTKDASKTLTVEVVITFT